MINKGAALLLAVSALAGASVCEARDHWVGAWGTAQQLAPMPVPHMPARPAGTPVPPPPPPQAHLPDRADARQADRPDRAHGRAADHRRHAAERAILQCIGAGSRLTIGRAQLAKSTAAGGIAPGSDPRDPLRRASRSDDPARRNGGQRPPSRSKSLRSIRSRYRSTCQARTTVNTLHPLGLHTTYVVKGDHTSDVSLPGADTNRSYFWLTGITVQARDGDGAIVTFGDSITDGYGTTPDTERAWPDLIAARLQSAAATRGSRSFNMGVSGNRVRRDGAGVSALARFDRDVLARPGVRWVVLLEGINDINIAAIPGIPDSEAVTAEQLIAAYVQLVDRAHQHGIKVAGGTITPDAGLWLYSAKTEALRQTLNAWIRDSGKFDAVMDFDAAVRDPADPTRLNAAFDTGGPYSSQRCRQCGDGGRPSMLASLRSHSTDSSRAVLLQSGCKRPIRRIVDGRRTVAGKIRTIYDLAELAGVCRPQPCHARLPARAWSVPRRRNESANWLKNTIFAQARWRATCVLSSAARSASWCRLATIAVSIYPIRSS